MAMGTLCTVYPYGYMGRCVGIGRRASALCADTARACASRALRRVYIYIYIRTHTHTVVTRVLSSTPPCAMAQSLAMTPSLSSRASVRGASVRTARTRRGAVRCASAVRAELGPELKSSIDAFIASNKVVLFMKGTKDAPRCGFSNTCVQILNSMQVPFADVDILANEDLRQGVKIYSSWPTYPQLYIGGEFFGGCDITMEAYKDGSLKEEIERAMLE